MKTNDFNFLNFFLKQVNKTNVVEKLRMIKMHHHFDNQDVYKGPHDALI